MLSLDGEPGFILHTRPYKEHSLLVELFTLNYGRLSAVARLSNKVASRSSGISAFNPPQNDIKAIKGIIVDFI